MQLQYSYWIALSILFIQRVQCTHTHFRGNSLESIPLSSEPHPTDDLPTPPKTLRQLKDSQKSILLAWLRPQKESNRNESSLQWSSEQSLSLVHAAAENQPNRVAALSVAAPRWVRNVAFRVAAMRQHVQVMDTLLHVGNGLDMETRAHTLQRAMSQLQVEVVQLLVPNHVDLNHVHAMTKKHSITWLANVKNNYDNTIFLDSSTRIMAHLFSFCSFSFLNTAWHDEDLFLLIKYLARVPPVAVQDESKYANLRTVEQVAAVLTEAPSMEQGTADTWLQSLPMDGRLRALLNAAFLQAMTQSRSFTAYGLLRRHLYRAPGQAPILFDLVLSRGLVLAAINKNSAMVKRLLERARDRDVQEAVIKSCVNDDTNLFHYIFSRRSVSQSTLNHCLKTAVHATIFKRIFWQKKRPQGFVTLLDNVSALLAEQDGECIQALNHYFGTQLPVKEEMFTLRRTTHDWVQYEYVIEQCRITLGE